MVEEGPERERCVKVYGELRKNVIDNVFKVRGEKSSMVTRLSVPQLVVHSSPLTVTLFHGDVRMFELSSRTFASIACREDLVAVDKVNRIADEQEWQRTGYVWEQYDAETGEGRRRYVAVYLCFHDSHLGAILPGGSH